MPPPPSETRIRFSAYWAKIAEDEQCRPGLIALFGSGETAPAGRAVHESLFRRLGDPIRVAVLETPAGFQPNSAWVAGRLPEFIRERLQNYHPQVTVIPARRKDGPFSTDDPDRTAPLLNANYIMGPGSPTYAVRHLAGTRAWQRIIARQRRGEERMRMLEAMPPPSATLLGIDEHTAVVLDLAAGEARVMGRAASWSAGVGKEHRFRRGENFPLDFLGENTPACPGGGVPTGGGGGGAGGRGSRGTVAPGGDGPDRREGGSPPGAGLGTGRCYQGGIGPHGLRRGRYPPGSPRAA